MITMLRILRAYYGSWVWFILTVLVLAGLWLVSPAFVVVLTVILGAGGLAMSRTGRRTRRR